MKILYKYLDFHHYCGFSAYNYFVSFVFSLPTIPHRCLCALNSPSRMSINAAFHVSSFDAKRDNGQSKNGVSLSLFIVLRAQCVKKKRKKKKTLLCFLCDFNRRSFRLKINIGKHKRIKVCRSRELKGIVKGRET